MNDERFVEAQYRRRRAERRAEIRRIRKAIAG